jgi:hypothetical protein
MLLGFPSGFMQVIVQSFRRWGLRSTLWYTAGPV